MYEIPPAKYGAEYILKILLNPKIDNKRYATKSHAILPRALRLSWMYLVCNIQMISKKMNLVSGIILDHILRLTRCTMRRTATLLLRNVVVVQQGPVWCILDACTVLTHLIQSLNG